MDSNYVTMSNQQPTIIFSPRYDIHFWGLEKIHPFDGRKYSRAWREARQRLGDTLVKQTIQPPAPLRHAEMLTAHTADYLAKLRSPGYVARVLETPLLASLPLFLLEWRLLRPMRLGAAGTILAAQKALDCGLAINLSGGYHHASREQGEGFTIYSDIALAIERLRERGVVSSTQKAMIIDLDAHQGNGHERIYHDADHVYILDMYNRDIYPQDAWAAQRINCDLPLRSGCGDSEYLEKLQKALPQAINEAGNPTIAIYIAGTDVYAQDQIGRLSLSVQGVLDRDKLVFNTLGQAGVPCAMVLGGGYSAESYRLIANAICYTLETWPASDNRARPGN